MYGEKADSTYEYGTLIRLVAANKWKVKFSNGGCFDVLEGQMEVLARKQNAIAEQFSARYVRSLGDDNKKIWYGPAFCGPGTGRDCFQKHLKEDSPPKKKCKGKEN